MRRRFTNWAGTHASSPRNWHEPRTVAELAGIVRRATMERRRVKVVGAAHSWSDIAVTDDVLISLGPMNSVLRIDPLRAQVTVQAGMRLKDLNRFLASRGLAMTILGSIAEQSVAGATATGTHGSSLRHGNLASFVRAVRMVTADGEVVDVVADDPRFAAVRLGLGALGIVVELTLQCEPAFRLLEVTEPMPDVAAIEAVADIARSAEYVKLWWLPDTRTIHVFRYHRTEDPTTVTDAARWFDENVVNRWVFATALRATRTRPQWIRPINQLIGRAYFRPSRQVGPSDRMLNIAMPPVHRETEYGVDVASAARALQAMYAMIRARRFRVNFVVEVRFAAADDAWMSPAYGRESCFIGAYMAESTDLAAYFGGFESLMREHGGRPHWGKEFTSSGEYVRGVLPESARFLAVRRQLDLHGTFSNAFVDRVLGPV